MKAVTIDDALKAIQPSEASSKTDRYRAALEWVYGKYEVKFVVDTGGMLFFMVKDEDI